MSKNINIPGRLHSVASDGIATGANEVYDDSLGKSQQQVNADSISYQEYLDNKINALEHQDIVPVDALPEVATADPKKIYRLTGEDSYTDYMVSAEGSAWKELATFEFPGIDDEPTAGSEKLVKSGGVQKKIYDVVGTMYQQTIDVPLNTILFDSDDVELGDKIYYKIIVPIGKMGAIRFFDSSDTILETHGVGSAQSTIFEYEGAFTVPLNFGYCKIVWGSGATIAYINNGKPTWIIDKEVEALSESKVDKNGNKVLSDNNFSNGDKEYVNTIPYTLQELHGLDKTGIAVYTSEGNLENVQALTGLNIRKGDIFTLHASFTPLDGESQWNRVLCWAGTDYNTDKTQLISTMLPDTDYEIKAPKDISIINMYQMSGVVKGTITLSFKVSRAFAAIGATKEITGIKLANNIAFDASIFQPGETILIELERLSNISVLRLYDAENNAISGYDFGFQSTSEPEGTKKITKMLLPQNYSYSRVEWNAIKINGIKLTNGVPFALDCIDSIKNGIEVIEYKDLFTADNIKRSNFIPLDNVDEIVFDWETNANIFFFKYEESHYDATETTIFRYAELGYYPVSRGRFRSKVVVPCGVHYLLVRSNDVNDKLFLIKSSADRSADFRRLQHIVDNSSIISDGFFGNCGEPNLLYDPVKGIVYENYICGESLVTSYSYTDPVSGNTVYCEFKDVTKIGSKYYLTSTLDDGAVGPNTIEVTIKIYGDPSGNFGFAKFPLNQPERAQYSIIMTYGETTFGELGTLNFRDTAWFWLEEYNTIRCITYGYTSNVNEWGLHYVDIDTDGHILDVGLIEWDSVPSGTISTHVNYDTIIAKIEEAGVTPYDTASQHTPTTPNSHYKQLWPSSTHIQEYNGYKYFALNLTQDVPTICRSNDNFRTIELFKAFQVKADYELALVINNSDWYVLFRSVEAQGAMLYTYSEDAGQTWLNENGTDTFIAFTGGVNSKPRGLLYDGKVVFLIPFTSDVVPAVANYIGTSDNIAASYRYEAVLIRGDKTIADINNWKREQIFVSKYGQNYGDLLLVGKEIFYAWSCDEVHLENIPVSGKCQVRFARVGNLDNMSVWGDF